MNVIYSNSAGAITSDTITREQIVALRRESEAAGDHRQADICGNALAGDEDSIRRCERVIRDALAMADG